jgi:hypothetical protein
MKKGVILIILSFLFLSIGKVEAAPTYWSGNGHYYELVDTWLNWGTAKTTAESMTYNGIQGYLATITSAEEQNYVMSSLQPAFVWLGGYQLAGSVEPADGWSWVTGEPWLYSNWDSGEPSNSDSFGHEENALEVRGGDRNYRWNDADGSNYTKPFIVEYDPVPEPISFSLLGLGFLGLLPRFRRNRT